MRAFVRLALVLAVFPGAITTAMATGHSGAVAATLGTGRPWSSGPTWGPAPTHLAALQSQPPDPCSKQTSLRSLNSNYPEWMWFRNQTSNTVAMFWLNYSGNPVFYRYIAPNHGWREQTFATHPWVVRTADRASTCLAIFVVPHHNSKAIIK